MERIIVTMRCIWSSPLSRSTSFMLRPFMPMPGSICMMEANPPIFFIWVT